MSVLNPRNARGGVLILAMGITVALAGLVLVFSQQMRVEALASGNLVASLQGDAIVRGAAQHVINRLGSSTDLATLDTLVRADSVPVGDGYFWIVRPNAEDERQYGYGIVDESSKLNINTASLDMLLLLPNMTPELAASIIDWRDQDETVTDGGGAESETYLLQPDPYYCKNAPFESIEELRLVMGATDEILFGVDSNHNGVVDASESLNATAASSLSLNGQAQCGIIKYLTVHSVQANTSSTGQQRQFVGDTNAQTMTALQNLLDRYLEAGRSTAIIGTLRGNAPPTNVLDFYVKSSMKIDEFKKIADLVTTDRARVLQGRINVNSAPREVLACLPGLETSDVEALIAKRSTSGSESSTLAWVAEALPPEKSALIGGLITTRSSQYSADIVGVGANGKGFKRVRYVLDLRSTPPRIAHRKDLTYLGWPLNADIYAVLRGTQGAVNGMGGTNSPGGAYSGGLR